MQTFDSCLQSVQHIEAQCWYYMYLSPRPVYHSDEARQPIHGKSQDNQLWEIWDRFQHEMFSRRLGVLTQWGLLTQ